MFSTEPLKGQNARSSSSIVVVTSVRPEVLDEEELDEEVLDDDEALLDELEDADDRSTAFPPHPKRASTSNIERHLRQCMLILLMVIVFL